jgi:rhomboid protease GluP
MCRNCGAIVAAGETVCPQCGAALASTTDDPEARRHVYDREAVRFARAVLTRPYTFTILFLVANLFVFLLMWSSSGFDKGALMAFPNPVLTAYGAKLNYLINAQPHEWWRFVTPIFIHINLPHILVNMWSLWVVGPYVEKLYGSAKFVFFWVLTGVAGVAASYLTVRPEMHVNSAARFLFKTMDNPSAGASGALFGLVGVLFVFGIKFRHELPEGFKRAFGTGLLPMILLNLFIGYLGRGFIDNAAHLGGFFSGAAIALFVGYKRPGERASVAVFWHVLQLAALTLVALSFLMVARHFPGKQQIREEAKAQVEASDVSKVKAYIEASNQGERALINALKDGDASAVDPAVKALGDAPRLDAQAGNLADELVSLLERARAFNAMKPGRARELEGKKIVTSYNEWRKKRDQWLKENGDRYGIELVNVDEKDTNTK